MLQLPAQDSVRLEREVQDSRIHTGIAATEYPCDMLQDENGLSLLDELDLLPDVAVCVGGLLGDQAEIQRNPATAERVIRTNYVGPVLLMGALAERSNGAAVASSSVSVWWRASGELRLRIRQGWLHRLPVRTAEPEETATTVVEATHLRRDVVYVRCIWRFIALVLRTIPERFFKRMNV